MFLNELIDKISELDKKIVEVASFVMDNKDNENSDTFKFNLELSKMMYNIEQNIYGLALFFDKIPNLQDKFTRLRNVYIENFIPKKGEEASQLRSENVDDNV